MSSSTPTDAVQSTLQAPTTKKKNNKKKKNANKPRPVDTDKNGGDCEDPDLTDEPVTPGVSEGGSFESPAKAETNTNGYAAAPAKPTNGHAVKSNAAQTTATDDTSAKLEVMSQEREALRAEVEQLRKQLESIKEAHGAEVSQLKADLEESESSKEHAESQYETLMGRVAHIKETLGDRLKRDKAELDEAKDRIDELEKENEELRSSTQTNDSEAARLRDEIQEQSREVASLRSRNNLSQQNWLKEKDDMTRQMQHLRSELESTSTAMGEWEVIAMEERSMRESLADKASDLEEQLVTLRESYQRAAEERDTQARAIDGLQRALQEIQDARKKELREMVETSEEQLAAMKKLAQESGKRAEAAEKAKDSLAKEVERTAPFEKEVKEKSLLIGKLRHEAIGLNEHLTRALKYIKKNKPEEMIDRQVVTNHVLQFLAIDRSDPRKFQILQVIAGLLNWTEEQKEQAGLARPGTATNTLRLPNSPFHRTPSSPALNTEFFSEPASAGGKESLADLWAGFLERSVEEGGGGLASRKDSMSSIATGTTRPDTRGQQN